MTAFVAWLMCDERDGQTITVSARRPMLLAAATSPTHANNITTWASMTCQSQRLTPTNLFGLYFAHSTSSVIKLTTAAAASWVAGMTAHIGCECSSHAGVVAPSHRCADPKIWSRLSTKFEQWSTSAVHNNMQSWVCS